MKKVLAFLSTIAILCCGIPFFSTGIMASASTNGVTQSQAVEWIKARGNEAWWQDVDGAYGCQCVDLIKAYYNYLGVGGYATGNGSAYTSNALPSGWTRDKNPTPGSIFACQGYNGVWNSGSDGHVGLVYAVSGSTVYTVETNLKTNSKGEYGGEKGLANAQFKSRNFNTSVYYIHPDFGGSSTPTTHTHNWVFQWFLKSHPHYDVYKCSTCGEEYIDYDSAKYYDLCETCKGIPTKPTLSVSATDANNDVVLKSSAATNATSYDFKIFDTSGNAVAVLSGQPKTTTIRLAAGTYSAYVAACNDSLPHGTNDRWWTNSDSVTFTVKRVVTTTKKTTTTTATTTEPSTTKTQPSSTATEPSSTVTNPTVTGSEPSSTVTEPSSQKTVISTYINENGEIVLVYSDGTIEVRPISTQSTPSETGSSQFSDTLLGDANGDGAVNMKDVLTVRKFLAGMDVSINVTNSDTNNDTFVNMKDVLQLRKYLAGLIPALGA